jgi:hypothetical protein
MRISHATRGSLHRARGGWRRDLDLLAPRAAPDPQPASRGASALDVPGRSPRPLPSPQSIHSGQRHGGIGEDLAPIAKGVDEDRTALVAGADQLEQHAERLTVSQACYRSDTRWVAYAPQGAALGHHAKFLSLTELPVMRRKPIPGVVPERARSCRSPVLVAFQRALAADLR